MNGAPAEPGSGKHVRRVASDQALWPANALRHTDYADAYEAQAHEEVPAEQWMRRVLEQSPAMLRRFVKLGWRFGLGFRPAPSTNILGWPVVEATDEYVLLEQHSWLVAASLLLRKTPTGLIWGTRVRYESPPARAIWPVVGLLHRRIVPYILARASAEAADK